MTRLVFAVLVLVVCYTWRSRALTERERITRPLYHNEWPLVDSLRATAWQAIFTVPFEVAIADANPIGTLAYSIWTTVDDPMRHRWLLVVDFNVRLTAADNGHRCHPMSYTVSTGGFVNTSMQIYALHGRSGDSVSVQIEELRWARRRLSENSISYTGTLVADRHASDAVAHVEYYVQCEEYPGLTTVAMAHATMPLWRTSQETQPLSVPLTVTARARETSDNLA